MKLCVTQQRLEEVPEPCFEQAEKLCVTQSGQVKLCVAQQRLGKEPEPGFEQAGKLCVTQSGQGEALCRTTTAGGSSVLHNRGKQSTASHNNGWRKCRNPALNRQKSSVSHNQDKQSSASHIKLCATQSGQGEALCLKTAREKAGTRF